MSYDKIDPDNDVFNDCLDDELLFAYESDVECILADRQYYVQPTGPNDDGYRGPSIPSFEDWLDGLSDEVFERIYDSALQKCDKKLMGSTQFYMEE